MFYRMVVSGFASNDLDACWTGFNLTTATNESHWTGWYRMEGYGADGHDLVLTADTGSAGASAGISQLPMFLTAAGLVTNQFFPQPGVMTPDKNKIVNIMNDGGGGFNLGVMLRRQCSGFSTNDLAGDWTGFNLTTANDPTDWAGWYRMESTASTAGVWQITDYQASVGGSGGTGTTNLFLTYNGHVTNAMFDPPGLMSADKGLIVAVSDDGGGGCTLSLITRRTSSGFSTADLEGQWAIFGLVVLNDLTDWGGWYRAEGSFDAQGNWTKISYINSSGDTSQMGDPMTWTITASGEINAFSPPAVMTIDKDMILGVMDDGGGGCGLFVAVRRQNY